jgi:hypothetical protein
MNQRMLLSSRFSQLLNTKPNAAMETKSLQVIIEGKQSAWEGDMGIIDDTDEEEVSWRQ